MDFRLLRPPGAGDEGRFRRRCVQCGQCAQVCPYGAIRLTRSLNPFVAGTPRVDPQQTPCWLCMRCGPACPSGALAVVTPAEAAMGQADIDKLNCFTYEGSVICRTCYEKCPLRGKAIVLKDGVYPVMTEHCVGCGVCEYVCPRACISTTPAAQIARKA